MSPGSPSPGAPHPPGPGSPGPHSPGPGRPDLLSRLSLLLLLVLAGLLLWPLLSGGPAPSPFLIASLLALRLGLQVWRARTDERYQRPASWALDLILIGLLLWVSTGGGLL